MGIFDLFRKKAAKPEINDALVAILARGDIYGEGIDTDQIPGTVGEFGLDVNNPVPVKSILGAKEYLDDLTFLDGTKIVYKRIGSTNSQYVKNPIEAYSLFRENGEEIATVYLSPYYKRNSRKKPDFQKTSLFSASPPQQAEHRDKMEICGLEFEVSNDWRETFANITPLLVSRLSELHRQDLEAYRYIVEEADRLALGTEQQQYVLSLSKMMPLEYSGESRRAEEFSDSRSGVKFMEKFCSVLETQFGSDFSQHIRDQTFLFYFDHNLDLMKEIRLKWAEHYHNNCISNGNYLSAHKWDIVVDQIDTTKRLTTSPTDDPEAALESMDAEQFRLAREVVYNRDEARYGGAQEILIDLIRKGYKEPASVFGLLAVLSGIPSEIEKGLTILQAGFDANDKASISNLGTIYQEGLSGEVNYVKALKYYVKAGELGSGSAWFNYGMMIVNGQGVERDLTKAEFCFQNAIQLGSENAKQMLEEIQRL